MSRTSLTGAHSDFIFHVRTKSNAVYIHYHIFRVLGQLERFSMDGFQVSDRQIKSLEQTK